MKQKIKKSETEKIGSGWAGVLWSMIEGALMQAGSEALEKISLWANDLKRSAISTIFVIIGAVFFLISVVLYINSLVLPEMRWLGFIFGGMIAIGVGVFFSRK